MESLRSVDSLRVAQTASVLADDPCFLPPEASVLDRHPEQPVLVFLVVDSEGVLMK